MQVVPFCHTLHPVVLVVYDKSREESFPQSIDEALDLYDETDEMQIHYGS